jgi:uncharacterized protein YjbI with pentapeptide repeats
MAGWWKQHRDEVVVALVSGVAAGAAVSVPIFVATARQTEQLADHQDQVEQQRFDRTEVLENVRFVRDRAAAPGGLKPFGGLNLRQAQLGGLPLGCLPNDERQHCTDLTRANLSEADLSGADLTGADLNEANLRDAVLIEADLANADLNEANLRDAVLWGADLTDASLLFADLTGTSFLGADLTGADLTRADLTGADLTDTDLTDTVLTDVCYRAATIWPDGFQPPGPSACPGA